ncbi:MAG: hypothetical protein DRN88_01015 [Candidatus Hydrothermarchaeota archaeon]|nr:MAG: hypothetical protein DRN88_01015 [Candidatus Hydrothermarchaeota archaeon]
MPKKVAITRAKHQAKDLAKLLISNGYEVVFAPTIEIIPNKRELIRFREKAESFDFVIFTSFNAVFLVFRYVDNLKAKLIAIGPKTKKAIESFGYKALCPRSYIAEAIIEEFKDILRGKKIAIPRSELGREILVKELRKIASVEEFHVYTTTIPEESPLEKILDESVDAITFTSSSTAKNLFEIAKREGKLEELIEKLKSIVVISIGPITTKTLEEYGIFAVTAKEYTIEGVVEALKEHAREKSL